MTIRNCSLIFLWFALALSSSCSLAAEKPHGVTTLNDLEVFVQTYYLHPQPELVPQAIVFIGSNSVLSNHGTSQLPTEVFFSKLFRDNPSRMADWKKVIDNQPSETKDIFLKALENSPEQLIATADDGMVKNDLNWAAFFASGDLSYVEHIVAQLQYLGEREDMNRFLAAGSAKWSLSANAKSHTKVRLAIQEMSVRGNVEMKANANDILTKTPEQIQNEVMNVVREQRKKGLWLQ
jgi:hypothetical protein